MAEKLKNNEQLVAKLSGEVKALNARVEELEGFIQQFAVFLDRLSKDYTSTVQLLQRSEHFLYSLIKVGLDSGLSFQALQEAMDKYGASEDLLVFWGVRTQEEYEQLKAQSAATKEVVQQVVDEHEAQ